MMAQQSICLWWPNQSLIRTRRLSQCHFNHLTDLFIIGLEHPLDITLATGASHRSQALLLPRGQQARIETGDQDLVLWTLDFMGRQHQLLQQQSWLETQHGCWIGAAGIAAVIDGLQRLTATPPATADYSPRLEQWPLYHCAAPVITDPRIEQAIEQLIHSPLSTTNAKQLADRFSVTEHHFIRLFKRETGLTLSRFRLLCRFHRFQECFGRHRNLTDAAHEAGFFDLSHFSRTYKQFMGGSPSGLFRSEDQWQVLNCDLGGHVRNGPMFWQQTG